MLTRYLPLVVLPRLEWWGSFGLWKLIDGLVQNEDVRLSDDAGHYCCDFLFYTGLVEYWRRRKEGTSGEDAPVAFLHVPGETEEEDVKRGVRVAEGLIRALVETRWGKDKVGGGIVSNVADGLVNMFGRRM